MVNDKTRTIVLILFIAVISISVLSFLIGRSSTKTALTTHRILYDAIASVESSSGKKLVSKDGRYLGRYQIGRLYWKDGTEFGKVNWSYDEYVFSKEHCEQVMAWYWERYKATTDQERATLHRSGPTPLLYWRKIQKAMKEQKNGIN